MAKYKHTSYRRKFGCYSVAVYHKEDLYAPKSKTSFRGRFSVIVEFFHIDKRTASLGLNQILMVTAQGVNERDAIHKAIRALRNQRYVWAVQSNDTNYLEKFITRKLRTHSSLLRHHKNQYELLSDPTDLKYVNHNSNKVALYEKYLDRIRSSNGI